MSTEEINVLEEVVKLKGSESFKDPEVLAKSVLNADSHIKDIERQNKELRDDLENRLKAEEILKAIEAKAEEIARVQREPSRTPEEHPMTEVDPAKVEALVNEAFQKKSQSEMYSRNTNEVNTKLREMFGDEAPSAVRQKAAELGMSTENFVNMAKESPSAFLTLMGQPREKQTNTQPTSTVNTASDAFNKSSEMTYAKYEQLRKENPKVYFDPKTQKQMQKDAVALGDRFFN